MSILYQVRIQSHIFLSFSLFIKTYYGGTSGSSVNQAASARKITIEKASTNKLKREWL